MEEFCIPDIRQIMLVSYQTIDTFSTWCEDIEVHINSKFTGFPYAKVKKIMQRLTEYKPNTVFPSINRLYYVLTETMLEVVQHEEVSGHVDSGGLKEKIRKLTSKSSRIIPIPSFDEKTVHQYEQDVKMLKKLIKENQQIYKDIQRQQEVCWIANSKMTTYQLYVSTAKNSRSHLRNQLPEKELKERNTAIKQLQGMLHEKKKRAAKALAEYNRLLDTENTTRNAIMQLETKITGDIVYDMTERLNSGLSALRQILSTKSNKKTDMLLSHIKDVESDMSSLASSIIDTLSSKYKCCNPQDFHQQNDFSVRLPDFIFIRSKERIQKLKITTKKTEFKNNNNNNEHDEFADGDFQSQKYLNPENLPEGNLNSMCFTKLSQGMVVKQKIAVESSDLVFGWIREKPWHQKKYGFFQKNVPV